jgi:hypothetical protein
VFAAAWSHLHAPAGLGCNLVPLMPLNAAASVARDRIANVLLARKGRDNVGGAARAAEDIARQVGACL